ncbi:MAG TPA: hypothetical protein VKT82_16690 [Ktedonobacterales bacterium]|nr:hypothetical protein [Ktedonobacterales bacterium]
MAERDQDFELARLEQQIEQPTGSLGAPARHLVEDLQRMYQTPSADLRADVESLRRVQRRLQARLEHGHREAKIVPLSISRRHEERIPLMKQQTSEHKPTWSRLSRGLTALAAAVLLVGLVGGLVTGLILVRHGGSNTEAASSPTATPTPPIASSDLTFSDIEMNNTTDGWARAANPANYTGANDTQILHTTDGGLHWKNITPKSSASGTPSGSASFHPLSGGGPPVPVTEEFLTGSVAWVLLLPNHLFKTTDGGQTWQPETAPGENLREFTFLDALHGWVITEDAGKVVVFRTTDGGATWTKMQRSGSAFPYGDYFTGMRFLNLTTGWATTTTTLLVTHDSGATWQPQQLDPAPGGIATGQFYLPVFFNAQDGVLVGIYPSSGSKLRQQVNDEPASGAPGMDAIYVTHDGGTTWEGPNAEQGLLDAGSSPDFSDTLHGWAIYTTWSGINTPTSHLMATSDSGRHWTQVPTSANFTDIGDGTLNFVSSQIGWAVEYSANLLLKTEDGGHTWTQLNAIIVS